VKSYSLMTSTPIESASVHHNAWELINMLVRSSVGEIGSRLTMCWRLMMLGVMSCFDCDIHIYMHASKLCSS
jgi:hypothetical protein